MKKRNPIAKAVRLIKPKIVPDTRRAKLTQSDIDELHEYADKSLQRSNRRVKP